MHFGGVSLAAACGAAAMAGHCWPVFLRFRGGKGVATGAGVVIYLLPLEALILLVVFLIIVYFSRFVSLGSICVAAALPIVTFIMQNPWQYVIMSLFFAIIVIFRHRSNIERLRKGTEKKLNERAI